MTNRTVISHAATVSVRKGPAAVPRQSVAPSDTPRRPRRWLWRRWRRRVLWGVIRVFVAVWFCNYACVCPSIYCSFLWAPCLK